MLWLHTYSLTSASLAFTPKLNCLSKLRVRGTEKGLKSRFVLTSVSTGAATGASAGVTTYGGKKKTRVSKKMQSNLQTVMYVSLKKDTTLIAFTGIYHFASCYAAACCFWLFFFCQSQRSGFGRSTHTGLKIC